ncbi:MAG: substrate-binding domain-containing protein [bacterium]
MKKVNVILAVVFIIVAVAAVVARFALFRAPSETKPVQPPTKAPSEKERSYDITAEEFERNLVDPNNVLVTLYYSSEKRGWIEDATSDFNSAQKKVDGKVIIVHAIAMDSGEALRGILKGDIKPTMWSPAADMWIDIANARWLEKNGRKLVTDYKSVVASPLVIAMWESMAKVLGYPEKRIGWKDIIAIATDPRGWKSYGLPELGEFKFGHTHPDFSSSGLMTVLAEAYIASGKGGNIGVSDVRNPQVGRSIGEIERRIVHYGRDASSLADKMFERGSQYLNATVLCESDVVEANDIYADKREPLVAIYPSEGTFISNHPIATVNAEWVTEEEKKAAEIYQNFLLEKEQQAKAMQYGLRPADNEVALSSPIDASHGVDPSQPGSILPTPGPEVIDEISKLWHKSKKKASIAMIIDRSGSMDGPPIEGAKRGATAFIDHMEADDEIEVVVFDTNIIKMNEMAPVSTVREQLKGRINGLYAQGKTALYDVMAGAVRDVSALQKQRKDRLYGIVILSDGEDTASKMSKEEFLNMLPDSGEAEGIKIYTIAYGKEADTETLYEVSQRTNAQMVLGEAQNIEDVYLAISAFF